MSLQDTIKSLFDETSDRILEESFFHENISSDYEGYEEDEDSVDGLSKTLSIAQVSFECVEQHGGEGEGEDYYTVYQFTKGCETVFVKFQGWYQSYNGSEMTGWAFVTPKQVMVTIYG
jgi:hypothetical protein